MIRYFIEKKTLNWIKNDLPNKFGGSFQVIILDEKCIDPNKKLTLGDSPLIEVEIKEKKK